MNLKGKKTIVDDNKTLTEKMKTLTTKNKISIAYYSSLLSCLHLCLDKMHKKNLQDKAHFLMGNLLTIAVYRIPKFNTLIMNLLSNETSDLKMGVEMTEKVNEIDK
jgi:hypothetical protein